MARSGKLRREERRNMALANVKVIKDEQTTQNRVRAAIEAHISKFDERISAGLIQVSRGRRLDVDAVLARSLPKVVGE
jgi:hypothetical protein